MLKVSFGHLSWIKILDANIFFRPKNQLDGKKVKLSVIIACFLLYNWMKLCISLCISGEEQELKDSKVSRALMM